MYLYSVTVKANLPYPIQKEYRINCWKLWTAMSRGLKTFRAEAVVRGKKISGVSVSVLRIGQVAQIETETIEQDEQFEDFEEEKELDPEERKRLEEQIQKSTIVLKTV